jgi:hypothetical protein
VKKKISSYLCLIVTKYKILKTLKSLNCRGFWRSNF